MSILKKTTLFILILFTAFVASWWFKKYLFSAGFFFLCVLLCYRWYFLVTEEFIVYQIMKSNGRMKLIELNKMYGAKAKKVIKRLAKNQIVEIQGDMIVLLHDDYKFTMKQMRKES